jgi:nucleoside-diphosphate-sugar epimerase
MRVLVTGCAGFIGSHLTEALVARGHEVVGIDCFTEHYARELKEDNLRRLRFEPRFTLHPVDLTTADLAPLVAGVELVYHLAGEPGGQTGWGADFATYATNNLLATQRLLEAVKGLPLRKFVYASTSAVYGDAESFPTGEAASPQPLSPYGVTKLSAEQMVQLYWRHFGVPTIALRYFTVYGPRQRPDMACERFIRAILEDRPLQVFGDGEQTRDFTFIDDVIAASLAAGKSTATGVVCNIGSGSRTSINGVLGILTRLLGRPLHVRYTQNERGDPWHMLADISRATELFGYKPHVSLQAGLAAQVAWAEQRMGVYAR